MTLESVGACPDLVVLYCYLVVVQANPKSVWPGRCLALALTTLFLHKYNYWPVTVLAMVVTEFTLHPRARLHFVWTIVRGTDWRRGLLGPFRGPPHLVLAATPALARSGLARG